MKRVGVVRVRELLRCLIVAAFTMSYTQVQLHNRGGGAAAASVSASASSFSKRVDLLPRSGSTKPKPSIAQILHTDNHRIAFIQAKLHHPGGAATYEPMESSTQTPLYSGQTIGSANYIMKVGLGTPAKYLQLAIDTGSSLAWTQCLPCDSCYVQKDPIFNPSASSSYLQVPCTSAQCAHLRSTSFPSGTCSTTNSTNCDYGIAYLDGSFTLGDFALEALSVGDNLVSAAFPFGCGHQNVGLFDQVDGILGLSRDSLAFPAQTKAAFGEVFAYCMPPIFSSSAGYIEFGTAASGGGARSTQLVSLSKNSLYVVELENVDVEGTSSISIKTSTNKVMVVDSGTVITRLDKPLYEQVRDALKKAASSIKEAPPGFLDPCYSVSNTTVFPHITFTFTGGLALTLTAQNLLVPMDDNGTFCLALLPIDSKGASILGNYQQQGHLFTFDIAHSTLSISSNVC